MRTWTVGLALFLAAQPLAAQPRPIIQGRVVDSVTGSPIEHVTVYYLNGQKTDSDRDGRFRINAPKGEATTIVMFRRIGYVPEARRVLTGSAGLDVKMAPIAVALDTLAVKADLIALNPQLSEFYRRRRMGRGRYLTRDDIARINPMFSTEILKAFPLIQVRCRTGLASICQPFMTRTLQARNPCPMTVILDGKTLSSAFDPNGGVELELDHIPASWIVGVEAYYTDLETPLELNGGRPSSCGTLVIWTGITDR